LFFLFLTILAVSGCACQYEEERKKKDPAGGGNKPTGICGEGLRVDRKQRRSTGEVDVRVVYSNFWGLYAMRAQNG
jgi:hypothetical protein